MRFVAQYPDYVVGVKGEKSRLTVDGEVIMRESSIQASFSTRGWTQRDLEVAMDSFQFKGIYQHEDEATPVNPAYRLSYYDTDEQAKLFGWDDETEDMVVRRLLSARSYGKAFVEVPDLPVEPPWPLYDSFDGTAEEAVLIAYNVIGAPFETVIAYEESKWGKQRPDFIEAFTDAIAVRDEGKVVLT